MEKIRLIIVIATICLSAFKSHAEKLDHAIALTDREGIKQVLTQKILAEEKKDTQQFRIYDPICELKQIFVGRGAYRAEVADLYACIISYSAKDRWNGNLRVLFKLDQSGDAIEEMMFSEFDGSY